MALLWTKFLETGIDWLDSQHRELFSRISLLNDAMSKNRGKLELVNLIKFLDSYVVLHFGSEESAMERFGYPEKAEHTEEHEKFKKDLLKIKSEIEKEVDLIAVLKVNEKAVDWLINHIGKSDKKLGEFLKGKI